MVVCFNGLSGFDVGTPNRRRILWRIIFEIFELAKEAKIGFLGRYVFYIDEKLKKYVFLKSVRPYSLKEIFYDRGLKVIWTFVEGL